MPVFSVNSFGVSFAMSFICGLSTMATLIEPPFPPVLEPRARVVVVAAAAADGDRADDGEQGCSRPKAQRASHGSLSSCSNAEGGFLRNRSEL